MDGYWPPQFPGPSGPTNHSRTTMISDSAISRHYEDAIPISLVGTSFVSFLVPGAVLAGLLVASLALAAEALLGRTGQRSILVAAFVAIFVLDLIRIGGVYRELLTFLGSVLGVVLITQAATRAPRPRSTIPTEQHSMSTSADTTDLHEPWRTLWRRKFLIVLTTAVVAAVAFGATMLQAPRYEAATDILFETLETPVTESLFSPAPAPQASTPSVPCRRRFNSSRARP